MAKRRAGTTARIGRHRAVACTRSKSDSTIPLLLRAMTSPSCNTARARRSASPTRSSGRSSRKPIEIGASPQARVTDTSGWQFARRPARRKYYRATPANSVLFQGSTVSPFTRTHATSPTRLSAVLPALLTLVHRLESGCGDVP